MIFVASFYSKKKLIMVLKFWFLIFHLSNLSSFIIIISLSSNLPKTSQKPSVKLVMQNKKVEIDKSALAQL